MVGQIVEELGIKSERGQGPVRCTSGRCSQMVLRVSPSLMSTILRQYDLHSDLPLGPPQLMMAYTADEQVDKNLLQERDQ